MTLDEAIEHCEEKAKGCDDCSKEHEQLAKWLKHLKELNDFASACRFAGEGGLEELRKEAIKLYKNYNNH